MTVKDQASQKGDNPAGPTEALHAAVGKDLVERAEALLKGGADPKAMSWGSPPLHRAKSLAMAKVLLAAGADPAQADGKGLDAYAHRCAIVRFAAEKDVSLGKDDLSLIDLFAAAGAEKGEAVFSAARVGKAKKLEQVLATARRGRTTRLDRPSLAKTHGYAVLAGEKEIELFRIDEEASRDLNPLRIWEAELPSILEHSGATLVVSKSCGGSVGLGVSAEAIAQLAAAKMTLVLWLSFAREAGDPLEHGSPLGARQVEGTLEIGLGKDTLLNLELGRGDPKGDIFAIAAAAASALDARPVTDGTNQLSWDEQTEANFVSIVVTPELARALARHRASIDAGVNL